MKPKAKFNFAGTVVKLETLKKTTKVKTPPVKSDETPEDINFFF
tara:strand:- start:2639 stop:2770 length:132 start_codon:yes stop_codon:yes gene_type:complete